MKRIIITIFFLALGNLSFGQHKEINQLNEKGQRVGEWIIYLDKNWIEVKDTNLAVFKQFEKFLNGKPNYFSFGLGKSMKKYKLEYTVNGESKFLNGEYFWYNKKNQLVYKWVFKNGHVITQEQYHKGQVENTLDYTLMYKDEPFSFALFYYNDVSKVTKFFVYKKAERGWAFYESDRNDPNIHTRLGD